MRNVEVGTRNDRQIDDGPGTDMESRARCAFNVFSSALRVPRSEID